MVNIAGGTELTLPKVNEIMNAIADQFRTRFAYHHGSGHRRGNAGDFRVEITVLGTSDMGARGAVARRPVPPRSRLTAVRPEEPAARPQAGPPASPDSTALPGIKAMQDEFGFGEVESRGQFEGAPIAICSMGRTWMCRPYLRKGIKIAV